MSYDYEALAASRFTGLNLAQLREVAKDLGVKLPPNCTDETAREKLAQQVGEFNPTVRVEAGAVANSNRCTEKPNLTAYGRWGGRRHRVKVMRTSTQDTGKGVPIGWEGPCVYALYDAEYTDLPEPHFNNLNNSVQNNFSVRAYVAQGKIVREETADQPTRDYQFVPMGITPGTENLPGSLREWYQWEAERKGYFAKFKQSRLEEIFAELYGWDAQTDPRTGTVRPILWGKDKIRKEILRFLGEDYLARGMGSDSDEEEEEAA